MKQATKRGLRVAAIAAAGALTLGTLTACSSGASDTGTFTIWFSSDAKSAQYAGWQAALDAFKAAHPKLTINVEQKGFKVLEEGGNTMLDSNSAPDVTEWNKGNSSAGTASDAGLLTNLNDYAKKYGWDKNVPASALQVGQYTKGLMGSGDIYGVPAYGEYVSYFYNADMLKAQGIDPATLTTDAALTAAFDKFVAAGTTPIASGDYMGVHLAYALALSKASNTWTNSYQFFQGAATNFNGPEFTYASDTIKAWVDKKYINGATAGAGSKDTDAVANFVTGKSPFLVGGTWLDQEIGTKSSFNWNKFLVPGNLSVGSAGNLWVVPSKSKNKDLAAEFINLTLQPASQNAMANAGGLPLFVDIKTVTNPTTLKTLPLFTTLVSKNALGFYPDWPVAGYYKVLKSSVDELIGGTQTPAQYRDSIGKYYNANKPATK
jgi:raffinose/stachyose/melibiose transport system substrate-binding protein